MLGRLARVGLFTARPVRAITSLNPSTELASGSLICKRLTSTVETPKEEIHPTIRKPNALIRESLTVGSFCCGQTSCGLM